MRTIRIVLMTLGCMALIAGCGSDSGSGSGAGGDGGGGAGGAGTGGAGGGSGKATGEAGCDEPDECAGNVCVAIIDGDNPPIYCTQECGTCPDKMYCDAQTFGLIGLSFCRFSLEPDGAAPATPPAPTEPPRLPCKEDGDCEGELVCATFQGKNDCTKICAVEDDCSPPSLGGVTFDLLTCGTDEGQARQVCLPDMACFPDIMSCIGGMPGGDEGGDMGGALGGMPGG